MTSFFKTHITLITYCCMVSSLHAQNNQWTWVGGTKINDQYIVFGTKGVAAANNTPGPRLGSVSSTDKNGNFWLFGGEGVDSAGNAGLLNDLWKWDGKNWVWISGSNMISQNTNYGTKGVAAASNIPGARKFGAGWIDNNGIFWLFGGQGDGIDNDLNELWKWDGTNWTWMKGSTGTTYASKAGIYGTINVPDSANTPGARHSCSGVNDNSGNLLLFGGLGHSATGSGPLNDLWKWDGSNWTWISGSTASYTGPLYGTKNVTAVSNFPSSRYDCISWSDNKGNSWFFGGIGLDGFHNYGPLNDLWKWDGTNWTWISGRDSVSQPGNSGTKNVAAASNMPGSRSDGMGWADKNGTAWIFGGLGNSSFTGGSGYLNDLWKWDGTNWVWVSGNVSSNIPGTYGTKGVAAPANTPGGRCCSNHWIDTSGYPWLYSGGGLFTLRNAGRLSDLWKWDGNNWTWISGDSNTGLNGAGNNGTKGVASSSNLPEARSDAAAWTDNSGNMWLFGGLSVSDIYYGITSLNDLWKWDGNNWIWISGTAGTRNQPSIYGSKNVAAASNIPGSRSAATSWVDKNNTFWLFGGEGVDSAGNNAGLLNDLWKWDGTNWVWLSGSKKLYSLGKYGTKGVADTTNSPPARVSASGWTDKNGNLWLFGGNAYTGPLGNNDYNDLWKWDGTSWTWVTGSNDINQPGNYGTKGVAAASNIPGARNGCSSWEDSSNNLWLFGGVSRYGSFNDLWKWDGTNWTWISGDNTPNATANYGTITVASSTNIPGARYGSSSWTDNNGGFWLFGGIGTNGKANLPNYLNDLWKWNGTNWVWVSGNNTARQPGVYGTQGIAATVNTPGARYHSIAWADKTGNLWLFGGHSNTNYNADGNYGDMWKFKYGLLTAVNTPLVTEHASILLLHNPSAENRFSIMSDHYYQKLNWQLLDNTGRVLEMGLFRGVTKGTIKTALTKYLPAGIYMIRFIGNDKILQTQKWIKQ